MWNTLTLTTSLLLYIIETEANTCYYSASNGEVLNFRCYNFGEYCCGRHCCASVAAFYRLWYFWLCVLLMVLLCSGGGYWYKRRYYQSNFMMPAGQTRMAGGRNNTVHTQNNFAFDSGIDRYPPLSGGYPPPPAYMHHPQYSMAGYPPQAFPSPPSYDSVVKTGPSGQGDGQQQQPAQQQQMQPPLQQQQVQPPEQQQQMQPCTRATANAATGATAANAATTATTASAATGATTANAADASAAEWAG